MPVNSIAYAAHSADTPLSPLEYKIHDPSETEVVIEVHYCGICHSDIHTAHNDWKASIYPVVPGHEFTGMVKAVGSKVTMHKVGDKVAVGTRVGSCQECDACKEAEENYCVKPVRTYGSVLASGETTMGGYGSLVVVPESFVLKMPDQLPMDKCAPLLCAGITTYSPLVHNKANEGGKRIGVVGLGGLGHMAVQFAAAFGNEVLVFSRTDKKKDIAKQLGAKETIITTNTEDLKSHHQTLDLVIDTIAVGHDIHPYLNCLKTDGVYVLVGVPPAEETHRFQQADLVFHRRNIMGSVVGSIKETQEMLNYCAQKNILPMVEVIKAQQVNEAYERVMKSDVQFRFVMDIKNSNPPVAP